MQSLANFIGPPSTSKPLLPGAFRCRFAPPTALPLKFGNPISKPADVATANITIGDCLWNRLKGVKFFSAFLELSGRQFLRDIGDGQIHADLNPGIGGFQSEMMLAINPTDPLQLVGFSTNASADSPDLFFSNDGGLAWSGTKVGNDALGLNDDSLGPGTRFDPSITFDAFGRLFVAYGFKDARTDSTRLVVGVDFDPLNPAGIEIDRFRVIANQENYDENSIGLDKWHLASGPDGLGGQAVYIAYNRRVGETFLEFSTMKSVLSVRMTLSQPRPAPYLPTAHRMVARTPAPTRLNPRSVPMVSCMCPGTTRMLAPMMTKVKST